MTRLGACFISDRFNVEEAVALSGAIATLSDDIRMINGPSNHNTRHPNVTASSADDAPWRSRPAEQCNRLRVRN